MEDDSRWTELLKAWGNLVLYLMQSIRGRKPANVSSRYLSDEAVRYMNPFKEQSVLCSQTLQTRRKVSYKLSDFVTGELEEARLEQHTSKIDTSFQHSK